MKNSPASVSHPFALHVAELEGEIHECISHIACGDLHAFEESLWRQELLTSALASDLHARRGPAMNGDDNALLQGMARTLLTTNQSYAELLRQVQRENAQLLLLSREYIANAHSSRLQNVVEV